MAAENDPLLGGIQAEATRLAAEIRALVAARWELLGLELGVALTSARWLAIVLAVAALAAVVALAVLIVAAGEGLNGVFGLPTWAWLVLVGATFLLAASAGGWLGYRRFRRNFRGLEETLAELREDKEWLREWIEPGD